MQPVMSPIMPHLTAHMMPAVHHPVSIHPSALMPRRDVGGQVNMTPGLQPSNQTANPFQQSHIKQFQAMSPEQLQEYVARLGNSPLASVAQRVLEQKRLMPAPPAPTQTMQQTPLTQDPIQAGASSQQMGMQPSQNVQQAARGGSTMPRKDTVPILAAGGEFVVSPHHVARMGDGDIKEGHRRLDEFVVERRKAIIKEMKALRGPVRS